MAVRKAKAKELRKAIRNVTDGAKIYDLILMYNALARNQDSYDCYICKECPARETHCEKHPGIICSEALTNWAFGKDEKEDE